MPRNIILEGDVRKVLRTFHSKSVDCIVTSPPYYGLRDYKIEPVIWDEPEFEETQVRKVQAGCSNKSTLRKERGKKADENWNRGLCEHEFEEKKTKLAHENRNNLTGTQEEVINSSSGTVHVHKYSEIKTGFCKKCGAWKGSLGLEPDVKLFVKHLCDIFDEVHRVLKDTGVVFVNLGDTYGGSCNSGSYGNPIYKKSIDKGNGNYENTKGFEKSLLGIPSRFMVEMIDRGWICRNENIWWKRNVLPASAEDRFTVDYEKVFMFTKKRKYFFEQQFEPVKDESIERFKYRFTSQRPFGGYYPGEKRKNPYAWNLNKHYRNKRTVWDIPTTSFSAKDVGIDDVDHYAVFPPDLAETCILAGTPEFVCKKCGKPKEKVFKKVFVPQEDVSLEKAARKIHKGMYETNRVQEYSRGSNIVEFIGYTDCGCNAGYEPGVVMDIFAGSGTTCMVAKELGRDYVGVEINPKYIKIAEKRIELGRDKKVKKSKGSTSDQILLFEELKLAG